LISLSSLAKIYQAKNIVTNARSGALAAITGTIIFIVVTVLLSPLTVNATSLLVLVILGVFYTVAAFFVRRSLNELAARSGISLFATAGLLLFIGAALTIVVIGVLIMWLAVLILVVAFFTTKEPQSTPLPNTHPLTVPTSTDRTNFCPNCGTPIPPSAVFCPNCEK
jgi:uncharacterized membrane protein